MKIKKSLISISKILIVLIIPILLFSTNFLLLLSPQYFEWEYSKEALPEPNEITARERSILSRSVLAYIKGITDVSCLEGTDLFTQREINHLNDVRILNNRVFIGRGVVSILLVYLILFTILSDKKRFSVILYVFLGSLAALMITLILFLMVYLNFNGLFYLLHKTAFPQDSWSFNSEDVLIELYPTEFWIDSAIIFLTLSLLESLILCSVSFSLMKSRKEKRLK